MKFLPVDEVFYCRACRLCAWRDSDGIEHWQGCPESDENGEEITSAVSDADFQLCGHCGYEARILRSGYEYECAACRARGYRHADAQVWWETPPIYKPRPPAPPKPPPPDITAPLRRPRRTILRLE
jgi:hypothetical protein